MKKIFAILSVVVLILSMGVVGFATEKDKESYTVKVELVDGKKEVVDKNTGAQHKVFTFDVTVTNNTKENMFMKNIDIEINAVDVETDEDVVYASEVKWDKDISKTVINIEDRESARLICEVPTNHEVYLKVSVDGGRSKTIEQIGESKEFTITLIEPTTITTTTTTTTTTETIESKPTETSTTVTEVSTTEETYTTETPTTVSEVYDYDYVAPIEDEIPATGSNGVALTVFGALGITAVAAAMVTKKKRH